VANPPIPAMIDWRAGVGVHARGLGHGLGHAVLAEPQSVATGPGDTALTLIPRGPNSCASVLVRLTSAAFAAP